MAAHSHSPSALVRTQPVPLMPRDQSEDFLLKRTGQKDGEAAAQLAEILGDLPLALEQAGAYIDASGITFKDYLDLFRNRRQELWQEETSPEAAFERALAIDERFHGPDHPEVATDVNTWALSFMIWVIFPPLRTNTSAL